jgi:hypothetical protein
LLPDPALAMMMLMERMLTGFEEQINTVLKDLPGKVQIDPTLQGVVPDFLVQAPDGRTLIVETKDWAGTKANLRRAESHAQQLKVTTGADASFVVLPGKGTSRPELGVLFQEELDDVLREELASTPTPRRRRMMAVLRKPLIFVAMPFQPQYDDVFSIAIVGSARVAKAACKRVDQEDYSGDVVEKIQSLIRQSAAVIADLSEARPNVLYEVGFAHALRKPTVHISSTPLDRLPFDVRNWNTIPYEQGQTNKLKPTLTKRLKAALSEGRPRGSSSRRRA